MSIIDVFLLLLIIVGIVSGIYLIISFKNLNRTLSSLEKDLNGINEKLDPILKNIKIITDNAVKISGETEKRILDISTTIQNVRNTVSKFSFSKKGTSEFRSPIQDLLTNLSALSKGISSFWRKLNN